MSDSLHSAKQQSYNVVLLNDDDHSFDFVINMLRQLFGYLPEIGCEMAHTTHRTGRVVVCTTSRERAELKRDLIQGFGWDPDIPRCQGPLSVEIEPAQE